jgi:hypothetical protein
MSGGQHLVIERRSGAMTAGAVLDIAKSGSAAAEAREAKTA